VEVNDDMMTIMGKRFTNRGVSTIIAALLLIAIAVAAGVLLYVFSIGLMGSLQGTGGQQTKDQVIMEAYSWTTVPTPLLLNLRNTGASTVNLVSANYYVNGIQQAAPTYSGAGCTAATFTPGMACVATVPISGFTPTAGVAYVLKIGLADGGVMSYSAVAGNAA
jgi:flagellin-like protein